MQPKPPDLADRDSLLKLLAILIRRSEAGELHISAAELADDEPGRGFYQFWDNQQKVMVLRYIPHGTQIYATKENGKWTLPTDKESAPVSPPPATVIQMVPAAQPSQQHPPRQPAQHVVLDDQRAAEIERKRLISNALREIVEYQPPEPPIMRRQPLQPQQQPASPEPPSTVSFERPNRQPQSGLADSLSTFFK